MRDAASDGRYARIGLLLERAGLLPELSARIADAVRRDEVHLVCTGCACALVSLLPVTALPPDAPGTWYDTPDGPSTPHAGGAPLLRAGDASDAGGVLRLPDERRFVRAAEWSSRLRTPCGALYRNAALVYRQWEPYRAVGGDRRFCDRCMLGTLRPLRRALVHLRQERGTR